MNLLLTASQQQQEDLTLTHIIMLAATLLFIFFTIWCFTYQPRFLYGPGKLSKKGLAKLSPEERGKLEAYREAKNSIGYKTAWFSLDGIDGIEYKPFMGVAGRQAYNFIDKANHRAHLFHSFYELENAFKHHQRGNVLLEVANSGGVQFLTLGMNATHQRVLQIILRDCSLCKNGSGVASWKALPPSMKIDNKVIFLCSSCDEELPGRPIPELANLIKEKTGQEIVVTALKSVDEVGSFVPTPRN